MCACIQFYLYLKIYVCTHISFCSGVDVTQARQLWHMDCTVDLSYLVHSCVIFQFFIFSVFHFFFTFHIHACTQTYLWTSIHCTYVHRCNVYIYSTSTVYFCIAIMPHQLLQRGVNCHIQGSKGRQNQSLLVCN